MVNVFILLILVWSLNLIASLYLDGKYVFKRIIVPIDEKAYTASFVDQNLSRLVYQEKKLLRTKYVPYLGWSRRLFNGKTTTVNHEGDRSHPLPTENPRKHIHFFGGSTMWGSGVDDANTIPAHFNTLHPASRAYNHGEAGFVSRQGLARLVNLVNQHAPMDLVVFYDGCNDSLSLCRTNVSINGHREEAKMAQKLERKWQVPDDLIGSIRTMIKKVSKSGERPISQCHEDSGYGKNVASTLVNNWKIAKAVAELGGAEFQAILQPVAPIGNPNVGYLKPRSKNTEFHLVYPHVQEIIKREKLDWIHDFTDVFNRDEYIYIDSCHVNGRGNQIIATKISDVWKRLTSLKTHDTSNSTPISLALNTFPSPPNFYAQ